MFPTTEVQTTGDYRQSNSLPSPDARGGHEVLLVSDDVTASVKVKKEYYKTFRLLNI